MFNPPHVHQLDSYKNSEDNIPGKFSAAIGDGSIALFNPEQETRKNKVNWPRVCENSIRLSEVHFAPSCCIKFVNEEVIGSAGCDKTVALTRFLPSDSKLEILHRFSIDSKPNVLCFPRSKPGTIFVCTVNKSIDIVNY